jgi:excisionase family DNA binding protein
VIDLAGRPSQDTWLTIGEAGRAVGISRTTLLAAEEAGLIAPARTPGGHRRYRLDDLRRYLARSGVRPAAVATAVSTADPAPRPATPALAQPELTATVRGAVRPLVQALDADSGGLYLLQAGALRFAGAFGVPRWLTDRLHAAAAPPPVVEALQTGRTRHFVAATVGFPDARSTARGLALPLRRGEVPYGAVFLVLKPGRELMPSELRLAESFRDLLTIVVDDLRRIADLEARLARIAELSNRA